MSRGGWAIRGGGAIVDFWLGYHDEPLYTITIHKLATPAKAPTVVAGTYAVTGSFKVAAQGESLAGRDYSPMLWCKRLRPA